MIEWLTGLMPEGYGAAIISVAAALLALFLILLAVRMARGYSSGTFIAGGRNRRARLAVVDAAAVDSRRRLVLVRRDDVEHLVLIGGPTDIVIEQNIPVAGAEAAAAPDPRVAAPGRKVGGPAPQPAVAARPRPPAPQPGSPASAQPLATKPSPPRQAGSAPPPARPEPVAGVAPPLPAPPTPVPPAHVREAATAPAGARSWTAAQIPSVAPPEPPARNGSVVTPPRPAGNPGSGHGDGLPQRQPAPASSPAPARAMTEAAPAVAPVAPAARANPPEISPASQQTAADHRSDGDVDTSLEDEMIRLLGELSGDRR